MHKVLQSQRRLDKPAGSRPGNQLNVDDEEGRVKITRRWDSLEKWLDGVVTDQRGTEEDTFGVGGGYQKGEKEFYFSMFNEVTT